MRKLTSIIWTINKEKLQELLDNSISIGEILESLEISKKSSGSYTYLMKRIKNDNLDLTKFKENKKNNHPYKKMLKANKLKELTNEELFTDTKHSCNSSIKRRIIRDNLIEYKCCECGICDSWNNKPISLQLDHINGINTDNRLENLRFLCPNCHSQTSTFGSKNSKFKQVKTKCASCGCNISKNSNNCKNCFFKNKSNSRKMSIEKDVLIELIKSKTYKEIGLMYGISDSYVKKILKFYNIECKPRRGKYAKNLSLINNISKEELEAKLLEYNNLDTIKKIYKCSDQTLKKVIKRFNIDYKTDKRELTTEDQKNKIIDLYKQKISLSKIAQLLNLNRNRIRHVIEKYNENIRG